MLHGCRIRPDTTMVFFESIYEPHVEVVDMRPLVKGAHAGRAGVRWIDAMRRTVFSYGQGIGADIAIISRPRKHVDGRDVCWRAILRPQRVIRGPVRS